LSNPNGRPGHNRPRLTRMDIQESNRLRGIVLANGWTLDEVAAVCICHRDTIKGWLSDKAPMSVERQQRLKAKWPTETAGGIS
jgi:hypothetical protein